MPNFCTLAVYLHLENIHQGISLFNDYLQDISNTFYAKKTLKGRKCEDNSSCTNNQSY
jgi:hypothetical protein